MPNAQRSIASAFEHYRRNVMPPDAGPTQVLETERAFYASAYGLLMFLMTGVGGGDDEEGVAILESLRQECEDYAARTRTAEPPAPEPAITEQGNYNVRSPEIESLLREMGRDFKARMPPGFGFTLFIFSYGKSGLPGEGEHGANFYISTADRQDMVKVLREFINRNTQ